MTPRNNNILRQLLFVFLATCLVAFVSGCGRNYVLKTKLEQDETVKVNDPVFVDGTQAGSVKALTMENGERIADLLITDKQVIENKARLGMVRVMEDNRISLRADGISTTSEALKSGTLIPTTSKAQYTVKKYATSQTLIAVGIALVVLIILCILFKSIFNIGLVVAALLLAGVAGWIAYPYATPIAAEFLAKGQVTEAATQQSDSSSAATSAGIIEVLQKRPDPRIVAFGGVTLAAFLGFSIVLGTAMRSLTRKH